MKTTIEIGLSDDLNLAVLTRIDDLRLDWEEVLVVVFRSYTELYYDNRAHMDRLNHLNMEWKNVF